MAHSHEQLVEEAHNYFDKYLECYRQKDAEADSQLMKAKNRIEAAGGCIGDLIGDAVLRIKQDEIIKETFEVPHRFKEEFQQRLGHIAVV